MKRKIAIGVLTIFALPLGAAFMATAFAVILPVFALAFPVLALGGAIVTGGKLANLLFDFFLGKPDLRGVTTVFNARNISQLVIQFVFITLLYIPAAVVIAAISAIVAPLLFIASSVLTSYRISKGFVNFVAPSNDHEYTLIDVYTEKVMLHIRGDSSDDSLKDERRLSASQQEPKSTNLDFFSKFRRNFDSEDDSGIGIDHSPSLGLGSSE